MGTASTDQIESEVKKIPYKARVEIHRKVAMRTLEQEGEDKFQKKVVENGYHDVLKDTYDHLFPEDERIGN